MTVRKGCGLESIHYDPLNSLVHTEIILINVAAQCHLTPLDT